jgi:NADH:ubiquinone oxidoreductase subunit E
MPIQDKRNDDCNWGDTSEDVLVDVVEAACLTACLAAAFAASVRIGRGGKKKENEKERT